MDLAHGGGQRGWFASQPREFQVDMLALDRWKQNAHRRGRGRGRRPKEGGIHPVYGPLDPTVKWHGLGI